MADKYTIQVQPQVSPSDSKKMEADLNKRFANVAGKFGNHLKNSVRTAAKAAAVASASVGAGIAGAILTNPFEKINEDLNATLEKFDNVAVRAEQFGVSSGKFFQAETIAETLGVKDFEMILNRYSEALEKAKPKQDASGKDIAGSAEDPYLQKYLGEKDVIDSFNAFAETLRGLNADQRNAAVNNVFGGKLGLRISELIQTDLAERKKQLFDRRGITEQKLTGAVNKASGLEDIQSLNRGNLKIDELLQKSGAISKGTVMAQGEVEKAKLNKDVTQLSQYEVFAKLTATQERAALALEGIRADFTEALMPIIESATEYLRKIFDWLSELSAKIKKKGLWGGIFG